VDVSNRATFSSVDVRAELSCASESKWYLGQERGEACKALFRCNVAKCPPCRSFHVIVCAAFLNAL
jgi:hypothetical protein